MKRLTVFFLAVVSVLAGFALFGAAGNADAQPPASGTIVHITNDDFGDALRNYGVGRVFLGDTDDRAEWEVIDAGDGSVYIRNVVTGNYLKASGRKFVRTDSDDVLGDRYKWIIEGQGDHDTIQSVQHGRYLDADRSARNKVDTNNRPDAFGAQWQVEPVDPGVTPTPVTPTPTPVTPTPTPDEGTRTVSGYVLDAYEAEEPGGTEVPVVGATIKVGGLSGITNGSGMFTILDVPVGVSPFEIDGSTATPGATGEPYTDYFNAIEVLVGTGWQELGTFYATPMTSFQTAIDPAADTIVPNPDIAALVVGSEAQVEVPSVQRWKTDRHSAAKCPSHGYQTAVLRARCHSSFETRTR